MPQQENPISLPPQLRLLPSLLQQHPIFSREEGLKSHTRSGSIVIRETISNIEKEFPAPDFIRIHRSFIVSLAAVDSYTNEYLEVAGKALPISRSYKSSVLEKLEKWAME